MKFQNIHFWLRTFIGLIFLWYGLIKYFPNASAAESIAVRTFSSLSFGILHSKVSMPLLATWECIVGICFISNSYFNFACYLLYIHMFGTFMPFFLFPDEMWKFFPFVPTLMGQYVIKNIVLISGAISLQYYYKNYKKTL